MHHSFLIIKLKHFVFFVCYTIFDWKLLLMSRDLKTCFQCMVV